MSFRLLECEVVSGDKLNKLSHTFICPSESIISLAPMLKRMIALVDRVKTF